MTATWRFLIPFLRPQWRALVVAALSTVVVAAGEVLRPFPLKFVIDHVFSGAIAPTSFEVGWDDALLLAGVAALVLVIALLEAAGGYMMDVHLMRAGERIVHDLRVAIYAHLQRLSLGFHQRRHTGDLVTRVTGDVNAVGSVFSGTLGTLVSSGLTLIGMIVVAVLIDPLLALVAFASAPLLAVVAFQFRQRMRTLSRRQRTMEGEIASLAAESLASMQQVKALGSERFEHARLERKSEERREAGYEATLVEGRFTRVIDFVGAISMAAVLVAGVFRVGAGALSPGDLVVMVTYARRVYRPLRSMAREWVRFTRSMARGERVAEVLAADDMLEDRGRNRVFERPRGELEFDAVSFAYEPGRPALGGVSLSVAAGERVALVGRSGAGKSTLAALAARFYDPDSGRLLIDGVDARDYPLAWLRDQVGLLLQDAVLFTGSVAENIAWGIDASLDDVVRAAEAAGADAFIRALPDGYDTRLDPGGTGLSGGQRQRIAIARMLLRDPAILLLDEPTRGLDAQSEADVLAGLDALMPGRTTVLIAHAMSLARRADRVVVLDAGRIVRTGTPDEFVGADGLFRGRAAEQSVVDRRSRGRAPTISDDHLPQAAVLLDSDAIAPVLARSFNGGTPVDVSIRYLRYKPGTNLMVQYGVTANGTSHDAVGMVASGDVLARRAAKPENVALARLAGEWTMATNPLAYDDDVGCLVQWYPLDLSLPTLATPPRELRLLLARTGLAVEVSDQAPERLAYKPRRRAVLRVDGHVVKLYRGEHEFERALAGQRAASTLRFVMAPRVEASSREWLITVQLLLSGRPVPSSASVAAEAGALLARLQASRLNTLPQFAPAAQLRAATASARLVGTIAPDLKARLGRLLSSLAGSTPNSSALVPSHGDFNARQLLVCDGDLALTDFDEFCLAAPALDPATFAAYMIYGRPTDLAGALAALDDLAYGYGQRPAHLPWYLATMILRRSARPFRYFEPDWRTRVEQMVTAAEEALDS
jgi:ABC-type multidrug transport system fused ATPase/permease subunit